MMTPAEFEDRLHDLLDARADPLADAACAEFLAGHPDRFEAFVRLQERCAALSHVAPPRTASPPWRRRLPWFGLAAAAFAVVLLAVLRNAPATAATPPAGRVLAASLRPIPTTLQPTAMVRASTVLLAVPAARLEVFTRWSAP